MDAILSLKPRVTKSEAINLLRGRGVLGLIQRTAIGSLRCVAQVYVPMRLYRVQISGRRRDQIHWFGLEAIEGRLDLYEFESQPDPHQMIQVETRSRPAPGLNDSLAKELLGEKVTRFIFQQGFFRLRALRFQAECVPPELHVPYWLGFYGSGENLRLRVIDAMRGCPEGAKARALFRNWLAS
jgi:hypothetical protein